MPGPKPIPFTFPNDFLQEARDAVRRRTIAVQDAQRFRLVLTLAEYPGISHVEAARVVGLSSRQVQRWRSRWAAGEFEITDRTGRGRKPAFSPAGPCLDQSHRLRKSRRNRRTPQPTVAG